MDEEEYRTRSDEIFHKHHNQGITKMAALEQKIEQLRQQFARELTSMDLDQIYKMRLESLAKKNTYDDIVLQCDQEIERRRSET